MPGVSDFAPKIRDRGPLTSGFRYLVLLTVWALLAFDRFLVRAVRNVFAQSNRLFIFGNRVAPELLKIKDAAKQHVAPLYQPFLRFGRCVINRFAVQLNRLLKPV